MTLSLERKIQIGFGIAVAIIVAVGAAALRSTTATVESALWMAHTLEARRELEATFADLITAETAVRGFVITGDTTYLGPYHTARSTLGGLLAGLRTLTADNPAQQRRLDSLRTLVATRLARFQWTIQTRRTGGAAAAARAVIGGRGKELMQLIRASIDEMEGEEGRLLAQRSATLQAKARLARLAAWSGAVVAVALAGIAGVLVSSELAGRRRAEQVVHETQARFRQMLASSTAVIYANTVAGGTFSPSWVSENITQITGYEVDEPLRPTWWIDHLHPDDRARVLAEIPVLLGNDRLTTEYRFQYKDGSYHWVHDESRLLRDAAGRPLEVVGSWVDITDRRQAEEALRASEERLRLLVGSVRDYAIYLLDATGIVVSWNPGAQQIKGYRAEEIVGQHFSRFYTPEDVAAGKPQAALQAAAAQGRFEEENWRIRKDGSRFWADVVISAVRDDRGTLVGFAKVTRDLTERQRAEEALRRHTAQLEAANAELDSFAYSVSHDLRAPLRAIDGFSQALLEDYADRVDDVGKGYLGRVRSASQRMATLIDDLLNLSRVTRREMQIGPLDLSALASGIAEDLKKRDPARGVEFAIAPGLRAQADPGLMRVVLQNLLENAWKFTGKRSDARIEVGSVPRDGRSAYFVRDNGAGFDMTYVGKLFGAFQRLHGAQEFDGTGIGLATVQRVIHRHGGRVWAEGVVGDGATFYFTL
ncbi:MAG: hypothetical protein AUH81_04590 [Candidatus Rokubacteria bacterium 13_1_40CM_4_69_5]|nr:MAG: hypothetical protein AUH81_04590 [Candidatus Rokubacteria bacterium 13_1_40CM_4_69_5]